MRLLRPLLFVLLGLLAAEALARAALLTTPLADRLAWRLGPTSTELGWWVHARDPATRPGWSQHDPLTGWRNRPGERVQVDVVERVDAEGLRVTGPRGRGPRVLLVGDSFTFGSDADDEDTWAWHLQAAHPDWAVRDAGVASWSLTQAWLRALQGDADLIVVGVNTLMVDRTLEDFAVYRRPLARSEGGGCVLPPPVPDEAALVREIERRPKLLDLARLAAWPLRTHDRALAWRRAEAQLDCLALQANAPLLVVWLPLEVDLDLAATEPGPVRAAWQAWCLGADVACVDATGTARRVAEQGGALTHGAHWSPAVHAAVARAVGPAAERVLAEGR